MDKWTGIIAGSNRGMALLNMEVSKQNTVTGNLAIYDVEKVNIAAKINGELKEGQVTGTLSDFSPQGDGLPTEGKLTATLSGDGKEIQGEWSTNIGTKGNCTLYKMSHQESQSASKAPQLTLESQDIAIEYSLFDRKSIYQLFSTMADLAKTMAGEGEVPIYSIKYEKDEELRTYLFDDFRAKFEEAEKIWYVGFEFKAKKNINTIIINLHYQKDFTGNLKSNVRVESTDRKVINVIPEMVRGMISKRKNQNNRYHSLRFYASLQILGVILMLAFSFLVGNKLADMLGVQNLRNYGFFACLIILSNLWTFISPQIFGYVHSVFPIVEIVNKPKSRVAPTVVIGIVSSITAVILYQAIALVLRFLM
jgi:hypothetical protein